MKKWLLSFVRQTRTDTYNITSTNNETKYHHDMHMCAGSLWTLSLHYEQIVSFTFNFKQHMDISFKGNIYNKCKILHYDFMQNYFT